MVCRRRWKRSGWTACIDAGGAHYHRGSFVVVIVLIWEWVEALDLRVDTFPPKVQAPVDKGAIEFVFIRVFDNDCPVTDSRLAPRAVVSLQEAKRDSIRNANSPVSNGHECPIVIAFCNTVWTTGGGKMTYQPCWTDQIGAQITSSGMLDVHRDRDMF